MVAGHEHDVTRIGERVANVSQRLRVVVDHEDARRLVPRPERPPPAVAGDRRRAAARLLGHRNREDEPRALSVAAALGPDASSVRLHQTLADGEPQAAPDPALAVPGGDPGVLPEQVRQPLRRNAQAFVADRNRDMHPVAGSGDPDGGRVGRVPGGVGEEVVQHLHDAPPVGHHPGKLRCEVDEDVVPPAAAQERVSRPVHQGGHLRGLGRHRERARVDAPRVQQIADEPAHVVGLLDDDAEELAHLRPVQRRRGLHQGGGGALDRGQRRAQLVAHHVQELGPQPLELFQRREILHGDDHRLDGAVRGMDRGRADQRGDTAPVGDRELDLLGAHGLGAAQLPEQRELVEGDLPPVREPARHHPQQLLGRLARGAQGLDDALRRPVERERRAGPGLEDHDADRRGVDQGLEVGAGPLLVAVRAGVGDGHRRLRREQGQDLLVLAGELPPAFLPGEVEVADTLAAVGQRHAHEGLRGKQIRGDAEVANAPAHVRRPHRGGEVAQVCDQPRPVHPFRHAPVLVLGDAGAHEVPDPPRRVDGRDDPVAGGGEGAGALDDLVQDGGEVEGLVDAQARRAQAGHPLAQRLVLPPESVVALRRLPALLALRSGGGAGPLGGGIRRAAVPSRIGNCRCGGSGFGCTAFIH